MLTSKEQILRIQKFKVVENKGIAREILQIPPNETESTKNITKYYRRLALLIHPDKVLAPEDKDAATEAFKKISQAPKYPYIILSSGIYLKFIPYIPAIKVKGINIVATTVSVFII